MLLINILGFMLIGLIVWWFWFYTKKEGVKAGNQTLPIVVRDGIYEPSRIEAKPGSSIELEFLRKDASPCAETVQFPGLEVSEVLPLNKRKLIKLSDLKEGVYEFHCQMQMYKGVLEVKS